MIDRGYQNTEYIIEICYLKKQLFYKFGFASVMKKCFYLIP